MWILLFKYYTETRDGGLKPARCGCRAIDVADRFTLQHFEGDFLPAPRLCRVAINLVRSGVRIAEVQFVCVRYKKYHRYQIQSSSISMSYKMLDALHRTIPYNIYIRCGIRHKYFIVIDNFDYCQFTEIWLDRVKEKLWISLSRNEF